MKRILRSAVKDASKEDAKPNTQTNGLRKPDHVTTRGKGRVAALDLNKENVAQIPPTKVKKTDRNDVAQPLQEKNVITKDKKGNKATTPIGVQSIEASKTKGNGNGIKSNNDMGWEENMELPGITKLVNPTTKSHHQIDRSKLPISSTSSPPKALRHQDRPKSPVPTKPTKKPTVVSIVKTRSNLKNSKIPSEPAASNVTIRRNKSHATDKSDDQIPDLSAKMESTNATTSNTENTQYVTTRINKVEGLTKQPIVSNVTTRQRSDSTANQKNAPISVNRSRRSKSVLAKAKVKRIDTLGTPIRQTRATKHKTHTADTETVAAAVTSKIKQPIVSHVTTRRNRATDAKITSSENKMATVNLRTRRKKSLSVPRDNKQQVNVNKIDTIATPVRETKLTKSRAPRSDDKSIQSNGTTRRNKATTANNMANQNKIESQRRRRLQSTGLSTNQEDIETNAKVTQVDGLVTLGKMKKGTRSQPQKINVESLEPSQDPAPPTKPPSISNVTTRATRGGAKNTADKNKKATIDKDTTSTTAGVTSSSVGPGKREREVEDDAKKKSTKRTPQLSANRNATSDVSDQSSGSTLPIYKQISSSNNITENSVFDFESMSQENSLTNDEEMKKLLDKLVRENKASVVKRKGKKGVAKAKTKVAQSNTKIEKFRSELKDLELKHFSAKVSAPTSLKTTNATTSTAVPKDTNVIHLIDDETIDIPSTSNKAQSNTVELAKAKAASEVEDVLPDFKNDVNITETDSVESTDIRESTNHNGHKESSKIMLQNTTNRSPARVYQNANTNKQLNPLYQSTPVRDAKIADASPWRVNPVKYLKTIFCRDSELEKSPIKMSNLTTKTGDREVHKQSDGQNARQPLTTKQVSDNLQKTEKPKLLVNDIENCFGFIDDSDDNDNVDDVPKHTRESFPAINDSMRISKVKSQKKPPAKASPPKKNGNVFKRPVESLTSIHQKIQKMKNFKVYAEEETKTSRYAIETGKRKVNNNSEASSSKYVKSAITMRKIEEAVSVAGPSGLSKEEKSQTTFAAHLRAARNNKKYITDSVASSSKCITMPKRNIDTTRTQEFSDMDFLSSQEDVDCPTLFETTWPQREDQTHRSYSRAQKRDQKRQYENKNAVTDDESEAGDVTSRKRTKRTKQKDDKFDEDLRKFEEQFNSDFMEVDKFEMIMEKST